MQLSELRTGIALVGLEPDLVSTVVAIVPIAEGTVQVIYRLPDGTIKDACSAQLMKRASPRSTSERPWAFDGDGDEFQLAVRSEAH